MNRWKFAFLSAGDHAKIKGQLYTIDEKIYKKQKKVTTILATMFFAVIAAIVIIQVTTDFDFVLFSFLAFLIFFVMDYLFNVFLIPKDIENYVTMQESDFKLEIDS